MFESEMNRTNTVIGALFDFCVASIHNTEHFESDNLLNLELESILETAYLDSFTASISWGIYCHPLLKCHECIYCKKPFKCQTLSTLVHLLKDLSLSPIGSLYGTSWKAMRKMQACRRSL